MKISVLGPKGTFPEIASRQHFPEATIIEAKDLHEVFENLNNSKADFAFVPFKNQALGYLPLNLSLINEYKLYIHDMKMMKVQICLAGYLELSEAKRLYVYPRTYKQCKLTLKKYNFKGDIILTKNNAESAKRVQSDDQGVAITSKDAAMHFNLAILAEGVQDAKNNKIHFVLLSKEPPTQELPRRDFYYFSAPVDYTAAHDMLKKVLKDSFTLDAFVSEENQNNFYLVSIDLVNKTHLVKLESIFPHVRYLGSYAL